MPTNRALRILLVALSLGAVAGASLATFCPEVERCAMAGAMDTGVAPRCSPEMGGDCCEEGEAPAGQPNRNDSAQAAASPTLLATAAEPVAPPALSAPPSWPADSTRPARLSATVPLYTLLATLLI